MVTTTANAQPAPQICNEIPLGPLLQAYVFCVTAKAQPLLKTEMTAAKIADSAIAACTDARDALATQGGICSVGHPVNLDDENRYLRDLIAFRIAQVRAGTPQP